MTNATNAIAAKTIIPVTANRTASSEKNMPITNKRQNKPMRRSINISELPQRNPPEEQMPEVGVGEGESQYGYKQDADNT